MDNRPFLSKLREDETISESALRFALSHDGQECKLVFLAFLFECALKGHLALYIDEIKSIPETPTELHSQLLRGAPLAVEASSTVSRFGNLYYLKRYLAAEERFYTHLIRLIGDEPELRPSQEVPTAFFENSDLSDTQRVAIDRALNHSLSLIVGGPGTGKSFTARALLRLFKERWPELQIAVAAPTGKAVSQLKEKVAVENIAFTTLHSLLKAHGLGPPGYHYDLIVVDEASMIDAELFARLFASVRAGARLVLLGDPEQLPPIEAGGLFQELLESKKVATTLLDTGFRAENSELINLMRLVQAGKMPPYQKLESFSLSFQAEKGSKILLTPLREGPWGSKRLNRRLYEEAMRRGASSVPIILTENDSEKGLSNGDLATLDLQTDEVLLQDGRRVHKRTLGGYELAYALSIHKSQGSEFDEVTILIPSGAEEFGRELIYTAVTRAKKKATLYLQDPETLKKMLSKRVKRYSGLSTRLGG